MTFCHCASVMSQNGASDCSPALFTRISTVPNSSFAAANIACTSASLETSAFTATAWLPSFSISADDFLRLVRPGDVVDDDIRAGFPELDGDRFADARTGAGDDGGLPFEQAPHGHFGHDGLRVMGVMMFVHGKVSASLTFVGWPDSSLQIAERRFDFSV